MAKGKASVGSKFAKLRPSLPIFGLLVTLVLSASAFVWRLTSLTAGHLSLTEATTLKQITQAHPWWKAGLNLYGPYYFLLRALYDLHRSVNTLRLLSILSGIISALAVYWLVSRWHGYKIGILTSILYITSFGVLALSRQATPLASELLPLALILACIALIKERQGFAALLILTLVFVGSLYIPGAVWLMLIGLLFCFRALLQALTKQRLINKIVLLLIGLALIAPLGYYFYKHFSLKLLANWLGYGLHGKITALKAYGKNLIRVPLDLFFRSSNLPLSASLGHLPLIPVAATVLMLLGLYCYITRLSNYRWRALVTFFILGWLLVGFGVLTVYLLLPIAAIMTGTGMAYLLKQWYSIFPKNPFARYGGLAVMIVVVSFICFFQARSYFVAWANQPATASYYHYSTV